MEWTAFFQTGLIEIILPSSVEVLGFGCFSSCGSLSSVIFESWSRLSRIGKCAFGQTHDSETPSLPRFSTLQVTVKKWNDHRFSNPGSTFSMQLVTD
jgi:hypothetical protein